jgi:hypothetical protein
MPSPAFTAFTAFTMTTKVRITERYDDTNLMAACLLAADPERYQGVLQEWADIVLSRAAHPDDREAGPLFQQPHRQAA